MIESFSRALDQLKATRRIGYFVTLGITIYAVRWSFGFPAEAAALGYSAADVALVIAAVMAPVTALQGYVIGSYYSKGTHNDLSVTLR